jgi:hypothetical protein
MAKEKIMYEDRFVLVTYYPADDRYAFSLLPTMAAGRTRLFLDQRLVDEFSRNNIEHLSSKLGLVDPAFYVSMSRTDIKRIHEAIRGTNNTYIRQLAEFRKRSSRKKQGL